MGWQTVFSPLKLAANLVLSFVPLSVEQWISKWSFILYRDFVFYCKLVQILYKIWDFKKRDFSFVAAFEENVSKRPNSVCFMTDEEKWTFSKVESFSNKVSRVYSSWLKRGDCVAVFMTNRIDYCPLWLGLAKSGIVSSLINCNLARSQLLHCIRTSSAKALIYSTDLETVVSEILSDIGDVRLYCADKESSLEGVTNLPQLMDSVTEEIFLPLPSFNDKLLYLYTSGTTGFPKPAIITHAKILKLYLLATRVVKMKQSDIIYNAMPMYHVSGIVGSLSAIITGSTVVVRKKFSATSFIPDCIKHKVTVAQYIGEVCRYVVNTERKEEDKRHRIRMITGNGIRADVWNAFKERFGVQNIVEYYGATESNVIRVNDMNKVGSCGYFPFFAPQKFIDTFCGALVDIDDETGNPLRGPDGFCIRTKPGNPGMMIGLIVSEFDGYLSKQETDKKCIRNVFRKGDKAFVTGDLFIMDAEGWLYFHDRMGDTFRWKGENVSTMEVENILTSYPSIKDCTVYGVEVKGNEGRAGMAAIVVSESFVEADFCKFLAVELPKYARPLFLRITPHLEYTSSFKLIKTKLRNEGYKPTDSGDTLLVRKGNNFLQLTSDIYNEIENETFKF